jgi:hypothetical protein
VGRRDEGKRINSAALSRWNQKSPRNQLSIFYSFPFID